MKYKIFLICIILGSLLLSTGCGLLPTEDERLSPPIKEAREIEYKTMTVSRMDIAKKINLFPQWKAATKITYSFTEFNAPLLEFKVSKGDVVKPGDIMAVLDIGDIDTQLRDMEITYQKQKLSYERTLERYNAGTLSGYDMRIAELDYEDVINRYNDHKEEKAGSLLVSDVEGTVLTIMDFEPEEMVNTGINIITIVKNDDIILQGSSTKIRTSPVNIGDSVILESYGDSINGTISAISGSLVTIEPEFMLDEWELGSTVLVEIPIESAQGVLVIDRQALRTVGGMNYVRVLIDGVAVEKGVNLGIESGRWVEVTSGLAEGELVIIY